MTINCLIHYYTKFKVHIHPCSLRTAGPRTRWPPALQSLQPSSKSCYSSFLKHMPPLSLQFEDDWAQDSLAAGGRRLLRLESENARNGLPLGLTIEPGGGGSSGGLAGGGAHVGEALLG